MLRNTISQEVVYESPADSAHPWASIKSGDLRDLSDPDLLRIKHAIVFDGYSVRIEGKFGAVNATLRIDQIGDGDVKIWFTSNGLSSESRTYVGSPFFMDLYNNHAGKPVLSLTLDFEITLRR